MIHNLHVDNDLRKCVNTKKLNRTCKYSQIYFSDINDIKSIKNNITFGSYQLKQALSYIAGHLTEDSKHEIFVNENLVDLDKSKLIMAKIQSRHINNLEYNVYIKYRPGGNSYDGIEGWYCTCKDGSRTIGWGSHITCIIYYFGYGKYEVSLKKPANHLNNIFPSQRLEFLSHLKDIFYQMLFKTLKIFCMKITMNCFAKMKIYSKTATKLMTKKI